MKYFTLNELTKSTTARNKNIDNTPTPEVERNLNLLVDKVLDPLREKFGKPIIVNSGYRCEKLNKAVGGAKTSSHCFDQNTEVLTNHGWRTIDTIQNFDQVVSYNLESDILELKPIQKIIKQDYDGILYYADSRHVQYAVTDEHRMLVKTPYHKYVRKNTRNISEEGQKYFDSLKTNNDQWHIELSKDVYDKVRIFKCAGITKSNNTYDVNLLRMCMAVISDGYLCHKNSCVGYGFNLVKERDKKELEDILEKLGWHYTKTYQAGREKKGQKGVYRYYINSTYGNEIYEIIGPNKKIPNWILSLNSDILRQLVITYAKFDGSIDLRNNNKGITIFSIDEENIDRLLIMCILSGMRCVKKEFKNLETHIKGHTIYLKKFYHLYITQDTDLSRMNKTNHRRFYYKGRVWCVNNENTTLVTRRNGKVSIQGNCLGQATDIQSVGDKYNKELFELCKLFDFDLLIDEYNLDWIHISYKEFGNRKLMLKASKVNGKTVYTQI